MKIFDWDEYKNDWLKKTRKISFEEIIQAIDDGDLLDTVVNPDVKNHPGQSLYCLVKELYLSCSLY